VSRGEKKDIVLGRAVVIENGVKVYEQPIKDVYVAPEERVLTKEEKLREYFRK
jgi:hypothetical protein